MDWEKWCLRVGAAAVGCALVVRLLSGGLLDRVLQGLTHPEVVSAIVFMETGRMLRPIEEPQPTQPVPETSPVTVPVEETQAETEATEPAYAVFAEQDADLVEVNSVCGYDADLSALLQKPLSWDLKKEEPTVLIVHTHGTESYTPNGQYTESSQYRTLDTGYNVVAVGAELAKVLESGGIKVVHDTTMHDHPSYTGSYNHARKSIQAYMEQYPSVVMVLDIHRDSVENSDGQQVRYTVETDAGTSAKLMMVVGTDANGLKHPNWPDNMALAVKLHAQLEKTVPGICRPISFRSQRFNQDLSAGAMLIEVGSAGNTHEEALLAAKILGQAILDISQGTQSG